MVFKNIRLFTKNWFLKIAQIKRKTKGLRYVRSTTIIKTAPNSTLNEKQHAANPIRWIDKEKLASFMDNRIIFSFSKNYDKNRSMTAFFFFFFTLRVFCCGNMQYSKLANIRYLYSTYVYRIPLSLIENLLLQ